MDVVEIVVDFFDVTINTGFHYTPTVSVIGIL